MCSRQVKLLKGALERRDTPFEIAEHQAARSSGLLLAQSSLNLLECSARSASYTLECGSYNLRMVEVISQHKRTPRRTFQTHQTAS